MYNNSKNGALVLIYFYFKYWQIKSSFLLVVNAGDGAPRQDKSKLETNMIGENSAVRLFFRWHPAWWLGPVRFLDRVSVYDVGPLVLVSVHAGKNETYFYELAKAPSCWIEMLTIGAGAEGHRLRLRLFPLFGLDFEARWTRNNVSANKSLFVLSYLQPWLITPFPHVRLELG